MRIGACLNMVGTPADYGTGTSHLEELKRIGYDYAELPLAEMTALSEDGFDRLADKLASLGLRCEVCNNFFPKNIKLTGPEVDYSKIVTYYNRALERAYALGVEYVVFGSGPAKNIPESYPFSKGYKQVVGLLKEMAPAAREKNISIVIEPLRKAECNLINTFEEGCRLADAVNEDNVKVLVDYYHMCVEEEPVDDIAREGEKYLRHVHFANPNGRIYPREAEESAYKNFFEALKAAKYSGRISVEAFSTDFGKDAEAALKLLREMSKKTH